MNQRAPLKLLIVDDHAAFRATVRQMFDGLDMAFTEAASGEEALRLFATERPDWVVMDLRMPGARVFEAGGKQFSRRARAQRGGRPRYPQHGRAAEQAPQGRRQGHPGRSGA